MQINKKGMYFTLMTIAFLIIFLFIFVMPSYRRLQEKTTVIEMRVDSMNDYIKDLLRDTERGLYISSFRALMSLEGYVIRSGEFLLDMESDFKEALMNGTVNNTNASLMQASTFPQWMENIQEKSSKLNIDTNITIRSIELFQDDPWHVKVRANLSLFIRDVTDIASWDMNQSVVTSVRIINFEDPLYIIYSFGRITNQINQTPFEGNFTFQIGGEWNISRLIEHVENSYYAANSDAPSFLMRFENNLDPSPYGIESLVNLKKLADLGLEINTGSSIVDYKYWDEVPGPYRINSTPSWYRLDDAHRAKYNVTHLSYIG